MPEPKQSAIGENGKAELFELGGRRWRAIRTRTLQLVDELEMLLHDAGLDSFTVQAGENAEAAARRLLRELRDSRKMYLIVGHLVLPEVIADLDWTPAVAQETARFVERLTEEADHAAVRAIVLNLVISFFVSGLDFSAPSPTASGDRGKPLQPAGEAPVSAAS